MKSSSVERKWLVIDNTKNYNGILDKNSKSSITNMRLKVMSIYSKEDTLQFSSHKNALF